MKVQWKAMKLELSLQIVEKRRTVLQLPRKPSPKYWLNKKCTVFCLVGYYLLVHGMFLSCYWQMPAASLVRLAQLPMGSFQKIALSWRLHDRSSLVKWHQQPTTCSKICFTDSFKLVLHVSGESFAHLQEHFDCIYSFLEHCTGSAVCCRPVTQIG